MARALKFAGTLALSSDPFTLGEDAAKPAAPSEFRIFKAGVNTSDKGDFLFDKLAAEQVMAAFAKKGTALTIDYEHMAAQDPPIIAPAAASSWTPVIRNGELWATNVNWTDKARGMIESREYTRFSPLFFSDPKTKRIVKVLNCALTNVEALDGVDTLVAATALSGEMPMKTQSCKACAKALKAPTEIEDGDEVMCTACGAAPKMLTAIGLKVDASAPEALVALSALTTFRSTVYDLTGKSNPTEAVAVLLSWKGKDAEVVTLRAAAEKAAGDGLQAEFDGVFASAVTDGKIAPAELDAKKTALSAPLLAMTGGKVTREAITALKAIVADYPTKVGGGAVKQKAALSAVVTEEDRLMAQLTGTSIEAIQKTKERAAAQAG